MLVTDWEGEFGLPADTVKGGLCISGIYDLAPVRLSWRRAFIDFTDEMEGAMSPQRHLDRLNAPLVVTYGDPRRLPSSSARAATSPQRSRRRARRSSWSRP